MEKSNKVLNLGENQAEEACYGGKKSSRKTSILK
jgi:hypothetical protein